MSGTHNALYIPPRPLYTKTTQGFIYSLVRVGIEEKHESKRTKCNGPLMPESWDAKDFIFGKKYFCPICATPEDGKCQVLKE